MCIRDRNIIGALVVKGIVLSAGALGYATLWGAVFADVGVALLAAVSYTHLDVYKRQSVICLVLILVDCVLKKSCYRLSINVKKQTILS